MYEFFNHNPTSNEMLTKTKQAIQDKEKAELYNAHDELTVIFHEQTCKIM